MAAHACCPVVGEKQFSIRFPSTSAPVAIFNSNLFFDAKAVNGVVVPPVIVRLPPVGNPLPAGTVEVGRRGRVLPEIPIHADVARDAGGDHVCQAPAHK